MKKGYLLFLFLTVAILVVVSACNPQKKVSFCGNGICEDTENCQCSDCASKPECKTDLSKQCDDLNECTTDSYNEATQSCAHEFATNCCGNGKCELEERNCDEVTHTTNCPKDCKFNCPASLIIKKSIEGETSDNFPYACEVNCDEVNVNNFKLSNKTGSIKTIIKNIGEITSGTITSSFYCYREGNPSNKLERDCDTTNGISVRDYFNNNLDTVNIKGKVAGNNTAIYYLKFDFSEIQQDGVTIICTVSLDDSLDKFKSSQQLSITFNK